MKICEKCGQRATAVINVFDAYPIARSYLQEIKPRSKKLLEKHPTCTAHETTIYQAVQESTKLDKKIVVHHLKKWLLNRAAP